MAFTVRSDCTALKSFFFSFDTFYSPDFFSWVPTANSATYPVLIKSFILYGHSLGISGIDNQFVENLKEHEISSNRSVSLKPVETKDLIRGPFSDLELENIIAKGLQCFSQGKMPLALYVALMFFAQTGRRVIQASDLKLKDLQESTDKNGIPVYYINVPRRKQRGQKFRETFNKTIVNSDLWIIMQLHAAQVKQIVEVNVGIVDENILLELPLFPSNKLGRIKKLQELVDGLKGDYLHSTSLNLSKLVSSSKEILSITSERTGELLNITTNRFRHTIGTNSAREGYGARVIAEILDHTTDVVAGTYVRNTPDIVKRLDKAIAMQLAPIAQAFAGVIVNGEYEATRGDDPTSRISNGKSLVGSCGSYSFCAASARIACYTCQNFQPWVDAPHDDVLTHLIHERSRIKEITGDTRISCVNDRLILAVADVIQRCEEHSKAVEEKDNG